MKHLRALTVTAAIAVTCVLTPAPATAQPAADTTGTPDSATSADRVPPVHSKKAFTVGLFGDMPYNAQGKADYPRLLADMNKHKPAFALYDGDLKAGGDGACTDELYYQHRKWFNSLNFPVVVTPGDNDWTDCWGRYGAGTGGYDALERLDFERKVFYPTDKTLGHKTMTVERQSKDPRYKDYRENVRFTAGPVLFVSVNFQGSNDNLPHAGVDGETRPAAEIARMTAEHEQRDAADIAWLRSSYAKAKAMRLKGVVVMWQADPNYNNEQKLQPLQYDGLLPVRDALTKEALAYDGRTMLVHGDSHYFKVDNPVNYPNGRVLDRFTRVETFGATNTHWAELTVDPDGRDLFTVRPRFVPGNNG